MKESSPITVAVAVSIAVIVVVLGLAACIGGSYLVGVDAARSAIHAEETAQAGKSKALCNSLKQLATTPAAHQLHPVFERVYANSGCIPITGRPSR